MEQSKDSFKTIKGEWNFKRKDNYVVNFKGRSVGKCTPTDLDWVLEIHNKVIIFAEVKRNEKASGLPIGQRILAENLCRYIKHEILPVYFLYVKGEVLENQIEIEKANVISWYTNKNFEWQDINTPFKVVIDEILKRHC